MTVTREYYLNSIVDKLQWLCSYIELQKKAGLTDILVYCEDFFCGLINIIYGVELKTVNKNNTHSIDLVDENRSIAIEITSNSSLRKIINTVGHFEKTGVYKQYHKLIVFVMTTNKRHNNLSKAKLDFPSFFNPETDIKDVSDLINDIFELSIPDIQAVYQYIQGSIIIQDLRKKAEDIAPKVLTDLEPEVTELLGRESIVAEIEELLQKNNTIVISGAAGIGKTAIASSLYYSLKHFVEHIGWIRSEGNLEKDLLKINIYKDLQSDSLRFSSIIEWLTTINREVLLFIDERDNPLSQDETLLISNISKKLKIIFTSRSNDLIKNEMVIIKEIGPLSFDNSCELFFKHYTKEIDIERDKQIRDSIRYLDGNPLLVILMSRAESKGVEKNQYSANGLLGNIQTILSSLSDDECKILRLFSILKTDYEIWSVFLDWADCDRESLKHLLELGIIMNRKQYYYIHDFVQEMLSFENELQQFLIIDFYEYGELISRLCDTESYLCDNLSDSDIDLRLSFPRAICSYVIKNGIVSEDLEVLLISTANALIMQNDIEEAMEYYTYCLRRAERNTFNIVKCYLGIAKAFCATSEYDKALENINRVINISKSVLDKSQKLEVLYETGRIYVGMNEFDKGITYLKKALKDLQLSSSSTENKMMKSKALIAIADAYAMKGECESAIVNYKMANAICKQASCYNALALCCHEIGNYEEALKNYKYALKMMSGKYDATHQASAIIRNNICCLLTAAGGSSFVRFEKSDLELFDFSEFNLERANFEASRLLSCNFSGTNLYGANFKNCKLVDVNFTKADLANANFDNAEMINVNLTEANLENVIMSDARVRNCDFSRTNLCGVYFNKSKMSDNNFSSAYIKSCSFEDAKTVNANFAGSIIEDTDLP